MSGDGALKTTEVWAKEDNRVACLHYCGWPEPAVRAVNRGCEFIPNICDMTSTGSKPFEVTPFPCAIWTNIPLCLGMMCIPCFGLSTNVRRLQKIEHLEGGKGSCAEHYIALLATSLTCVTCCYVASMRASLRKKYDIQGSNCMDFFCSCMFGDCTTCQEVNEMQKNGALYVPYASIPSSGSKVKPAESAPHGSEPSATKPVAVGAKGAIAK